MLFQVFLGGDMNVNGDVEAILDQVPEDRRITPTVWEFIDKDIRGGVDLNQVQRDSAWGIVRVLMEKKIAPPPLAISMLANCFHELSAEAKTSEDAKRRLMELVKFIKADPKMASIVSQCAQLIVKERERRKQDLARAIAAMQNSANAVRASDGTRKDPPNIYLTKIQSARLGFGENPAPNLELAVQVADEAVEAYPNIPKILFEAAGCHQKLAEKGRYLSLTARYVHLKEAYTLYEQCLDRLLQQPYGNLHGEYDGWRKGLAELLPKIQENLTELQERQERQK
jgi:hypothetical protein